MRAGRYTGACRAGGPVTRPGDGRPIACLLSTPPHSPKKVPHRMSKREGCIIAILSMVLTAAALTYLAVRLWPYIPHADEGPRQQNFPYP